MVDVYVASAFSKDGQGGNQAGVVIGDTVLTCAQKLRIAQEPGYSETAFALGSGAADWRLESVTPTGEVPLCGHAALAAFVVLRSLHMLRKPNDLIETKAGVLRVAVKEDGTTFMEQNRPAYLEVLRAQALRGCFSKPGMDGALPIQVVSTGLKDIMLPMASAQHLAALEPDDEAIRAVSREKEVAGIHAFAFTEEPGVTAVCRKFAPPYGIHEESATGTACCALACYLFKHYERKTRYVFEQGRAIGAVSRIIVNITCRGSMIDAVCVGGHGDIVCKKTLAV